jgi:hypothetical protein
LSDKTDYAFNSARTAPKAAQVLDAVASRNLRLKKNLAWFKNMEQNYQFEILLNGHG